MDLNGEDVSDMDDAAAVMAEVRKALAENGAAPAPAPVKAPAPQKRPLIGYVSKSLGGIDPAGTVAAELAQPLGEQAELQQHARAIEEGLDHVRDQEADHVIVPRHDDPRSAADRKAGILRAVDDFSDRYVSGSLTQAEQRSIIETLDLDGGEIENAVEAAIMRMPVDGTGTAEGEDRGKLATEFLEAKKSPETLQTFTNLVLGEPWKTEGDDLDEHELFGRREPFRLDALPDDVLFLTAGVDCQDDRLEVVIMGHGRTDIFALDHRILWGPIDGESVWHDLDSLLKETWQHPNGGTIRIDAACIDSGDGGHTEIVNGFTRPRYGRRVVSIKGVPGFSRQFLQKSGTKGQLLWLVGSDAVKSQLFTRLARGAGVRFGEALEPIYFEQLTSERRVMRYVRGVPQARFERIKGKRAETLDATCYAWAARQLIGVNMERRAEELASAAEPKKAPAVIKSAWLNR